MRRVALYNTPQLECNLPAADNTFFSISWSRASGQGAEFAKACANPSAGAHRVDTILAPAFGEMGRLPRVVSPGLAGLGH
jgi:hypothetical protein